MSDVKCVVCGEPWDYYHVQHELRPWERELFRAGAGCPSCEGASPEGGDFQPEALADVELGDEDPMLRINAFEARAEGRAPKWEKPADVVLWECDGCGVQAVQDADEDEPCYHVPSKSQAAQWYSSHPFRGETAPSEPHHVSESGVRACEHCAEHCVRCGATFNGHVEGEYFTHYQEGMCVYYVCSEDCLCAHESDQEETSWQVWGAREFRDALRLPLGLSARAQELLQDASDEQLRDLYDAMEAYDFCETSPDGASYDFGDLRFHDRARQHQAAVAKLLRDLRG